MADDDFGDFAGFSSSSAEDNNLGKFLRWTKQ